MALRKYHPGDIVGIYTVLEYSSNNRIICRCNNCGHDGEIFISNLTRSKMCRFCRTKYNTKPKDDLTGQRFGRLTVQNSIVKEDGHSAWRCICECGEEVIVSTSHLKSGHTRSCGCYMKNRTSEVNSIDLSGMRFGKLLVLQKSKGHKTPAGQVLSEYLCICDCGIKTTVLSMNLTSGNTRSCGCIGSSFGEYRIRSILSSNNIYFTQQHSFDNLRSRSNGGLLKFDFAIWNPDDSINCLIEYNGEQHYYPVARNTDFGKLQREETDDQKIEYCQLNNIRLFIIRFDDNIDEVMQDIVKSLNCAKKCNI